LIRVRVRIRIRVRVGGLTPMGVQQIFVYSKIPKKEKRKKETDLGRFHGKGRDIRCTEECLVIFHQKSV
jgi:hypothetical protein